jgi:hypothetical protein
MLFFGRPAVSQFFPSRRRQQITKHPQLTKSSELIVCYHLDT